MRIVTFLLITMTTGGAFGANIVRFGPTLCDSGQQMSAGQCIDIDNSKCPSGYYETVIPSSTYSAVTLRSQCMNAYNKIDLPEYFHPLYSGILVKFGPGLCGANEQMSNGKCVEKVQGQCPSGFYKSVVAQNTFSSPSVGTSECMNAYNLYDLVDYLSMLYNGVLVNFGAKLCDNGQYLQDGECAPYDQGECPTNFHTISPDDATLIPRSDGKCGTGYMSYWLAENCADDASKNGMCAQLCDAGLRYTGVGTCATPCENGISAMHTSNGKSWPTYAQRQTTPAMGIATSAGICYINFLPGAESGLINVKSGDNKIYHITD